MKEYIIVLVQVLEDLDRESDSAVLPILPSLGTDSLREFIRF